MKLPINLNFISDLKRNLNSFPQFIQVILGPRQVGKTTTTLHFLEQEHKDSYHYVSADKLFASNPEWLRVHWQKAREDQSLLVVDEIQKIENWSELVKGLWDEEQRRAQPIQCILLGSSSLDIQKGLTESLTGRFQLIRAHHWNFSESARAYQLSFEDYMRFGGYPASYVFLPSEEDNDWYNYVSTSIIGTVIEKDILMNNTVRSPALFKQAFQILAAYPAQEISYTKLLGQLQSKGNTELIKHYLALYEGAYLFKVLEKFSPKVYKKRSSSPKILPLCPALYQLNQRSELSLEERGRVLELMVGAQLVRTGLELTYWREGNFEVDFVVQLGKKIIAIEVKSGRRRTTNGVEKFLESYPQASAIFITQENYEKFELDPLGFIKRLI